MPDDEDEVETFRQRLRDALVPSETVVQDVERIVEGEGGSTPLRPPVTSEVTGGLRGAEPLPLPSTTDTLKPFARIVSATSRASRFSDGDVPLDVIHAVAPRRRRDPRT